MDFSKPWSTVEAILVLYFYNDESLRRNGERRESMEMAIRHVFAGNSNKAESIEDHEIERIKKIAGRLVRADGPKIDLSWPGILWMRWAFEKANDFPIASGTLRLFSNWRDDFPYAGTWRVIGRDKKRKNGSYRKRRTTPQFGTTFGFTLDEFLHVKGGDLVGENDLYAVTWTLKRYSRVPQPNEKRAEKHRVKAHADEGIMVSRCGRHLLETVRKCVKTALKQAPPFLKKKRIDGRYECHVSRSQLAHWLRQRFTSLGDYKESNILRALSAVVDCPKGNTKSRMSIKKVR